jgi:hypothetical protein
MSEMKMKNEMFIFKLYLWKIGVEFSKCLMSFFKQVFEMPEIMIRILHI